MNWNKTSLKKALLIILVVALFLLRNIEYLWANQLVTAIQRGDSAIVEEVLDRRLFFSVNRAAGTPFFVRYTSEWCPQTALCAACQDGDLAMTRLLLEHGADPDKWTFGFDTPLNETLQLFDDGDEEIVELLLSFGASADKKSWFTDEVPLILTAGIPAASANDIRETIHYDREWAERKLRIYQMIYEAAKNKTPVSKDGAPLLIVAARAGDLRLVSYMIEEQGFDINEVDREGNSALFLDLTLGEDQELQLDVVEYLLEHGIDTSIRNKDGLTAYEYAEENHNGPLKKLLEGVL